MAFLDSALATYQKLEAFDMQLAMQMTIAAPGCDASPPSPPDDDDDEDGQE